MLGNVKYVGCYFISYFQCHAIFIGHSFTKYDCNCFDDNHIDDDDGYDEDVDDGVDNYYVSLKSLTRFPFEKYDVFPLV